MAYAAVHILRRIGLATSVVSMVSPDTSPTASDQHFRKPGSDFRVLVVGRVACSGFCAMISWAD